jgi:uncharacterized protein YegL
LIEKIKRIVEAFVGLCLGTSGKVTWCTQPDSGAFSDANGQVFLPQPTGLDGELRLLVALALQEVSRLKHSTSIVFAQLDRSESAFCQALEEARLKQAIFTEFKGSRSIFDEALEIVATILANENQERDSGQQCLNEFAIWFAANDSVLKTSISNQNASKFFAQAVDAGGSDIQRLAAANSIAKMTSTLKCSADAIQFGRMISNLLLIQESQDQPSEGNQGQSQDQPPEGNQGQSQDQPSEGNQGQSQDQPSEGNQGQSQDQPSEGDQGQSQDQPSEGNQGQSQDQPSEGNQGQSQDQPSEGNQGQSQDQPSEGNQGQSNGKAQQSSVAMTGDPLNTALARLKGHSVARQYSPSETDQKSESSDSDLVMDVKLALQAEKPIEKLTALLAASEPEKSRQDQHPTVLVQSSENTPESNKSGLIKVSSVPQRLISSLLRMLQDKRTGRSGRAESGRDIDISNVWRLKAVGDTRIFHKKSETPGVNSSIYVLLDVSKSMQHSIHVAADTAHGFCYALQRISGMQSALGTFSGLSGRQLQLRTLLDFQENSSRMKAKIQSLVASGSTPTGEAILQLIPKMLSRKTRSKIIVLISDGLPNDPSKARHAVITAELAGVDVYGIGVGDSGAMMALLPNKSVSVSEFSELTTAIETLFSQNIRQRLLAA